jgi:hypothetical protein
LRWLDFFVTFCIKTKSNGPLRPRADEGTSSAQIKIQNALTTKAQTAQIASYLGKTNIQQHKHPQTLLILIQ